MAEKRLDVVIFGGDGKLWAGPSVRITLTDPNQEKVRTVTQLRTSGPTASFHVNDLFFDRGQTYTLLVEAPKHRSAWQVVSHDTFIHGDNSTRIESDQGLLHVVLVPARVASSDLPTGYQRLLDTGSTLTHCWDLTPEGYAALAAPRQMALHNIAAKLEATRVSGSTTLMSYVVGLRGVDADRLFLMVAPPLKQLVARSPEFASAQGHGAPSGHPTLPAHPDSWKHKKFPSGNIQLSFARTPEVWPADAPTTAFSVDVDIDLARDVGHAIEWIDNNIAHRGKKTDQAEVYMLLFGQDIRPLFTFDELATNPRAHTRRLRRRP